MIAMASLISDQRLNNQVYYEEIIKYLQNPTQISTSTTDINWVKTQAANYFLKDGELYYGKRKPRKVVLDEQSKNEILSNIHVDSNKGFHNGVKKMHRLLQKEYFWRYSYKSITEFVQNCLVCKSNTMQTLNVIKHSENISPWKEIEFHRIQPNKISQDNHELVIIYDPVSLWVSAAAIKQCSCEMAEFILENFCNYGVASCTTYGLNSTEFKDLTEQFSKLIDAIETASAFGFEDILKFSEGRSANYEINLKLKVDQYFQNHPDDWNKRSTVLAWLWKMRNEFVNNTTGMSKMSDHFWVARNKSRGSLKQRRIPKLFRCLSCIQTFDSAILLQLHASCHSSGERLTRSFNSKHLVRLNGTTVHQSDSVSSHPDENRSSTLATVAAVRALIAQTKGARKTKDERHKRGEYHRYTPDIREAIAVHAIRHGTRSAARTYSASLGFSVSYSSVRNFVQAHHAFSSQTKAEIGRYAAECGIDAAKNLYASKLNKSISTALVRKFRRMYLRITPASQLIHPSVSQRKSASVVRYLFCTSVREEIGKYAALHGVQATVRHFSEKLQFPVKESTVRKFKKTFGTPSVNLHHRPLHTSPIVRLPSPPPPNPSSMPPPTSVTVIQQQTSEPNYYHQPFGHYTSTQYGSHQSVNTYHSHHQNLYVMAQSVPPYPSYSSLPPPPQYQPSMQLPAYSRNWNEECHEVLSTPQSSENAPPTCLTLPRPPSPVAVAPPPLEPNPAIQTPIRQDKISEKKKKSKKNGRGSYATYSPQFRLEIGRFAVKHGCQEAAKFFKNRVGHEIPESTVRGLRDKYIAQQSVCEEEVSSLNVAPRGRPLRLGSHDTTVQECIRELKRSGERVNAFVVMATARQVLLQKEPSLLSEYGGPVKLTTNWAKSFLKRIGINNESNSQCDELTDPSDQPNQ